MKVVQDVLPGCVSDFFLGGAKWSGGFGRGMIPRYDIKSKNCFEVIHGGWPKEFVINDQHC